MLIVALAGPALLAQGSQATAPALPAPAGASIAATAWSSGWVDIDPGQLITLQHNLGGDPSQYSVQLWFWDTDAGGFGINTRAYGGLEVNGLYYGAFWRNLDGAGIGVYRHSDDTLADRVRVWIWVPQPLPEYCSPWTPVAAGASAPFAHNLGRNVDDYAVGLWFSDTGSVYGVNQTAYGGMEDNGQDLGAWWHDLTTTGVQVHRAAGDPYAGSVRVCVSVAETPDYDSGWVDINPGQMMALHHDLGGDTDRYVVRMEFEDTAATGLGIHHENAGGNAIGSTYVGANWENLTESSIRVVRRPDDAHTGRVRLRIWMRRFSTYLPVILNDK